MNTTRKTCFTLSYTAGSEQCETLLLCPHWDKQRAQRSHCAHSTRHTKTNVLLRRLWLPSQSYLHSLQHSHTRVSHSFQGPSSTPCQPRLQPAGLAVSAAVCYHQLASPPHLACISTSHKLMLLRTGVWKGQVTSSALTGGSSCPCSHPAASSTNGRLDHPEHRRLSSDFCSPSKHTKL